MDEKLQEKDRSCLLWVLGSVGCLAVGLLVLLFSVALQNARSFECRSMQSEVKTNLSGLFTAEKAFFAEYGVYTTDLVSLPWFPDGAPKYVYGFAAPSTFQEARLRQALPGYDPTRTATDHLDVIGNPPRYGVHNMGSLTGGALPARAVVGARAFVAAGAGNLDADPALDVWTIDENKKLVALSNDCEK